MRHRVDPLATGLAIRPPGAPAREASRNGSARSAARSAFCWLLAVLTLAALGCDTSLQTDYGPSSGTVGQRSINGFAGLRAMFRNRGWRERTVQRLSDRQRRNDVLVWTPQRFDDPPVATARWIDEWLSQSGRTLVLVLPDSGAENRYWREAMELAPPQQRFEYRRRAARAEIAARSDQLSRRTRAGATGRWFDHQWVEVPYRQIGPFSRREAAEAEETEETEETEDGAETGEPEMPWRVEVWVEERSGDPPAAQTTTLPWEVEEGVYHPPVDLQWSPLVVVRGRAAGKEADVPLVTRIGAPRWNDSQILVVSGGSLLCNLALVDPRGRQLAAAVVDACGSPGMSGWITSYNERLHVTEGGLAGATPTTGMEMLTVWPLNLVTMHGALLGLILCLMLLPIFGRPRALARPPESDFADHLDAVARLLEKNRGEAFARQQISEYMKRVRGEVSGDWVLPEVPPQREGPPKPSTPVAATPSTSPTPSAVPPGGSP